MKRFLLTGFTLLALAATMIASQSGEKSKLGTDVVRSNSVHAFGAIHPRISPDGQSIVFSYHDAIWRMPRTGGTMVRLSGGDGFDREPVWSPDGKKIAYVNFHEPGAGDLKLIDAENGKPIALPRKMQVRGTVVYYKLYFHPDGQQLLGFFRADGKDLGLSWFNLKTGETTAIVVPERWSRYALSHDGKTIVFTPTMNVIGQQGGNNGPQADIMTVSSAGGEPKKVLRFPARVHDVCFAADDRSLYVATDLGNVHYDLWNVPLDGSLRSARRLTSGQADEHRPSVSSDGRWLIYSDNKNRCTSVVVRDLSNGIENSVVIDDMNHRQEMGTLRVSVVDGKTGKPTTARVSIEREDGKFVYPVGSLHRVLRNYGHFYCAGNAKLTVPAGKYRMRAFRGPEYRVTYQSFEVEAGESVEQKVELDRWIHNAEKGWYSGENHIHANYGYGEWYNTPESMLEQSAGEDLNVSNFVVANSDTDGVFDREFFRGGLDPNSTEETLLYWNQEFRSTIWGHMTLVNLSQLVEPIFTGFKDTTNPWDIPTNSDVADRTHLQNGLVNYTHVAQNPDDPYKNPYTGKSIPIDVALGKIDTLDINNSYPGTVVLWHWLLNCGFRLPASAGTDCFLNRISSRLPGGDRVYVKLDGRLTYSAWIDGLRAGRSFATNGPMLELSIDGKGMGDVLQFDAARDVSVAATARAQFPLEQVELIYNGKVVATGELAGEKLSAKISEQIKIEKSGWIALRAMGPGHPDHPLGSQYAHTSPIYVEVGDQPAGSVEDAERFLKWIDRIELAVRVRDRIPSEALKKHVQQQLEAARAVYRRIAEMSGEGG